MTRDGQCVVGTDKRHHHRAVSQGKAWRFRLPLHLGRQNQKLGNYALDEQGGAVAPVARERR